MTNKLLTNKITALFMGHTDLNIGKFFPFRKMTWKSQKGTNYLDCTICSIGGAKQFLKLYPKSKSFIEYGEEWKYSDISCSSWRNRMPLGRPLEKIWRNFYGFDLEEKVDPVEYSALSGGYRAGDKDCLFPEVAPNEQGNYNFIFRGIDVWRISSPNKPELEIIPVGTKINLLMPDKWEIEPGKWVQDNLPPKTIRMKMVAEGKLY